MSSFLNAFADGYDDLDLGDGHPVYPGPGPDKPPEDFTSIRQTGGMPYQWPTNALCLVTLQVNIIGPAREGYGRLHERAMAAFTALHLKTAWSLDDGYSVDCIQAMQPPYDNGIVNGLQWVSFNLLCHVRYLPEE